MKFEEIPFEPMMPDLSGEGTGTFASGVVAEGEPVEKPENIPDTPAERGKELDKVQGVVRKMGALAIRRGGVQERIDRFLASKSEVMAA